MAPDPTLRHDAAGEGLLRKLDGRHVDLHDGDDRAAGLAVWAVVAGVHVNG